MQGLRGIRRLVDREDLDLFPSIINMYSALFSEKFKFAFVLLNYSYANFQVAYSAINDLTGMSYDLMWLFLIDN